MSRSLALPTSEPDPFFVFDYVPIEGPDPDIDHRDDPDAAADAGERFSTYWEVQRGQRGPQPLPDWVVTDRGALDRDLGVLKTGKEADVSLLRRTATDGVGVVMAAKRYRGDEHRSFHRSAAYTEGRQVRRSRDTRALARKSTHGRAVAAGQWAHAEWDALGRYWEAGVPVPYPVQIDGTEILMEFIGDQATLEAAPRLAQTRPEPDLLAEYFAQLRLAISVFAAHGVAHGDLSPYNVLADGDRVVVIDLPQVVDLVANPSGQEFLLRDCRNICTWFAARGLAVDTDELFAEVVCFTL